MMKKEKKIWNSSWPALIMAPMDDVTDFAFRQVFAQFGVHAAGGAGIWQSFAKILPRQRRKNFVSFTEFVSADGLSLADEKGKQKLLKKLKFKENEHPIVAQIFGSNIDNLKEAAKLVEKLGFDGVDINMGCPDKSVEKTGSGSALIKNPELAKRIVKELKAAVNIPVSVKTRLGYYRVDFEWIKEILSSEPAVLTVHLRTRQEMSKVDAHWEAVDDLLKLRDEISPKTKLVANGDIKSLEEAKEKISQYNLDGVMVGRGLFGNPLFFGGKKMNKNERIRLLKEHIKIFEENLLSTKSYSVMKKHFKAYISDFDDARALRARLMETQTPQEALEILSNFSK